MEVLDAVDLPPSACTAIKVWNWLHIGSGEAIDWAGLPVVCALLGVHDVERLLHDLMTIKTHATRRRGDDTPPPQE